MEQMYAKTRAELMGKVFADPFYWINKGRIPIGTLFGSPDFYTESDVVWIPFDSVDESSSFTTRALFNLLLLGGSGDGKSLLNKVIWYFMQKAGYKVCYIEAAKLDEAARAAWPWKSSRLPPHVEAERIPLTHYIPSFVARTVDDSFIHNFRVYASNLSDLIDAEYWMSMGLPRTGASIVARIIQDLNEGGKDVSVQAVRERVKFQLDDDSIFKATYTSINNVLMDVQENKIFDGKPLELYDAWQEKNSVVISYDDVMAARYMVFDVGQLIKKASRYATTKKMKTPMLFIFGDASSFLKGKIEFVESNMALNETRKLGNNYRSKGLNGILEIQSVDLVDSTIAETFKIKIISPLFANPASLAQLNIPAEVIKNLNPESGRLHRDKDNHDLTWQLVLEDGSHVRFRPFTPPCMHFTQKYRYKEVAEV